MHILTNTSRSKGNQAMKFGQLIENTRASIFLEKSWTKLGGETIRSLKNKNWEYFWITILKFYKVCFHCIPSWGLTEYLSNRSLAFTSYKVFFLKKKKKKRGLELISLPHFLHYFWRKIFLLVHSITGQNFIVWLHLLREILGNMCIVC